MADSVKHSYIRQALADSCLIWQLSDLTAVRSDSCQNWQLSKWKILGKIFHHRFSVLSAFWYAYISVYFSIVFNRKEAYICVYKRIFQISKNPISAYKNVYKRISAYIGNFLNLKYTLIYAYIRFFSVEHDWKIYAYMRISESGQSCQTEKFHVFLHAAS